MKRLLFAAAVLAAALVAAAAATADNDKKDGFKTAIPPMLIGLAPESSVEAIISTGDTLAGNYSFGSIPDGIALRRHGNRAEIFVNHETSTVPFPYALTGATEANSQNDFENAQLSRLVLGQSGRVLQAGMAITSADNWQRFCSNYLPTKREGFDRRIVLTNEEGIDWVKRTGKAWPATIGAADSRQVGTVVAHDVKRGTTRPIWGLGRHNHENSVAIPGYGKPVVLSGDDAFNQVEPQSQLYTYIAKDADAVMNDSGDLWAFVSDNPAMNNYYAFTLNDTRSVSGSFVKVPKDVATGRKANGTDLMAADKGYPAPPNDGTWQQDPTLSGATRPGVDGPQWVLERWGDTILPRPVFQFLRIEDIAYDKRPGMSNVVYLADSGRGLAGAAANGKSTNGRVWKMVLDKRDPTKVLSLSILIEGDDNPTKTPTEIHQPDNIESTRTGLLITEDPGSQQQFSPGDADATTARIMGYPFATGIAVPVAMVDQSLDEKPGYDVDGLTPAPAPGRWGTWESSGIVDASSVFGPGAFLVTIQAHTLWIAKAPGDDNIPPAGPDFTYKREGGQLVLLRLPGWTGGNDNGDDEDD